MSDQTMLQACGCNPCMCTPCECALSEAGSNRACTCGPSCRCGTEAAEADAR